MIHIFDRTALVGVVGGGAAMAVAKFISEYGGAVITILTIIYILLGIRNRIKERKD